MKKQRTRPATPSAETKDPALGGSLARVDSLVAAGERGLARLHTKVEIGTALGIELAAGAVFAAWMERAVSRKARAAVPKRFEPITVIGAVLNSTLLSNDSSP